jgi:hypothetical protein
MERKAQHRLIFFLMISISYVIEQANKLFDYSSFAAQFSCHFGGEDYQ